MDNKIPYDVYKLFLFIYKYISSCFEVLKCGFYLCVHTWMRVSVFAWNINSYTKNAYEKIKRLPFAHK